MFKLKYRKLKTSVSFLPEKYLESSVKEATFEDNQRGKN